MSAEPEPLEPSNVGNPELKKAIAELSADPSDENRNALYKALNAGPLIIALKELPKGIKPGAQQVDQSYDIQILTSDGPEGQPVILAFTDLDALTSRKPGSAYIAIESARVLEWVVESGYGGIIINPDGPWAGIPREDVEILLGISGNKGESGGVVSHSDTPALAIEQALTKLLHRVNEDAFVIFKDVQTKKFVQFAASTHEPLLLDLPKVALSPKELRCAEALFHELGVNFNREDGIYQLDGIKNAEYDVSFQMELGPNVRRATQVAMSIFFRVYNLPEDFEIIIEEN